MRTRSPIAFFATISIVLIVATFAVANLRAEVPVDVVYGFPNSGGAPYGDVTFDGNNLYGTTRNGGTTGFGAVFSIHPDGSNIQTLHSFSGLLPEANTPYIGLTLVGTTLWGMTSDGGSNNRGAIFSLSTTGMGYQIRHSFAGTPNDGAMPYSSPGFIRVGSTLYGTTYSGGSSNEGTVFSINADGTGYQVLHSFTGTGQSPIAGVTAVGSTLYGTTTLGGETSSANAGTIYSISTSGTGFHIIHDFSNSVAIGDGFDPTSAPIVSGSILYGTTQDGGAFGYGTVYSIHSDGTILQVLHSFTGTSNDGANPNQLILIGSTLYGTTNDGAGRRGDGHIFSIHTDGSGFANLHTFTGNDGAEPETGLVQVGTQLFGTTVSAQSNAGVIFSITPPDILGDFNRDGHVNAADIPTMLTALTDLNTFKARNSLSDSDLLSIGDIDGSGAVTNADINALIGLLRSGGGSVTAVPEPASIALVSLAVTALLIVLMGAKPTAGIAA